jgi:hypothetical protein
MGTISLVGWVMAGSFTNSSSRLTSSRITLPNCKSCVRSICRRAIMLQVCAILRQDAAPPVANFRARCQI